MKAYQRIVIILLAFALCLGMFACNPANQEGSTTPEETTPAPSTPTISTLHYATEAGVSEATMKADIINLLGLPAETTLELSGTFDLNTSGKYTLTCKWGENEQTVAVWVYSNAVNVLVDGQPFVEGDTVHLNYKKAEASQNFTSCIR